MGKLGKAKAKAKVSEQPLKYVGTTDPIAAARHVKWARVAFFVAVGIDIAFTLALHYSLHNSFWTPDFSSFNEFVKSLLSFRSDSLDLILIAIVRAISLSILSEIAARYAWQEGWELEIPKKEQKGRPGGGSGTNAARRGSHDMNGGLHAPLLARGTDKEEEKEEEEEDEEEEKKHEVISWKKEEEDQGFKEWMSNVSSKDVTVFVSFLLCTFFQVYVGAKCVNFVFPSEFLQGWLMGSAIIWINAESTLLGNLSECSGVLGRALALKDKAEHAQTHAHGHGHGYGARRRSSEGVNGGGLEVTTSAAGSHGVTSGTKKTTRGPSSKQQGQEEALDESALRGDKGIRFEKVLTPRQYLLRSIGLAYKELPLIVAGFTCLAVTSGAGLLIPTYQVRACARVAVRNNAKDASLLPHRCCHPPYVPPSPTQQGRIMDDVKDGDVDKAQFHRDVLAMAPCSLITGFLGGLRGLCFSLVGRIVDDVKDGHADKAQFHRDVLAMALCSLITGIFGGLRGLCFSVVGKRVLKTLQDKLFEGVIIQDIAYFDSTTTGELTSRLTNDVAAMSEPINWQLSALVRNLASLVGGVLLCFVTSWKLSILAFTTMAPILHITAVYSRWSRDLNRKRYACGGAVVMVMCSAVQCGGLRAAGMEDVGRGMGEGRERGGESVLCERVWRKGHTHAEPINWQLSALVRNLASLVGGVLLCFVTSWKLSILAFTTMAPILHITAVYSRWSRDLNRKRYAVGARTEPINWQLSVHVRNQESLLGCVLHITVVYSRWSRDLNRKRYARAWRGSGMTERPCQSIPLPCQVLAEANSAASEALSNIRTMQAFSTEGMEREWYERKTMLAMTSHPKANSAASEALSSIRTVRAFSTETVERERYKSKTMATHLCPLSSAPIPSLPCLRVLLWQVLAEANSAASEALSNIRTVRAFSTEGVERERYESKTMAAMAKGVRDALAYSGAVAINNWLDLGASVLILWYGGVLVMEGHMRLGQLIAFQLYWNLIQSGYQSIMSVLMSLTKASGAAQRVLSLIDSLPDIDPDAGTKSIMSVLMLLTKASGTAQTVLSLIDSLPDIDPDAGTKVGSIMSVLMSLTKASGAAQRVLSLINSLPDIDPDAGTKSIMSVLMLLTKASGAAQRVLSLIDSLPDIDPDAGTKVGLCLPSVCSGGSQRRRQVNRHASARALLLTRYGMYCAQSPPQPPLPYPFQVYPSTWILAKCVLSWVAVAAASQQWFICSCASATRFLDSCLVFHPRSSSPSHLPPGVSIHVDPGQVCALVGRSGGGKSTVVHLLMRFYDPVQGRIVMDGRDLRELNLRSVHAHMGLVAQDTQMWACSIEENIAYGLPSYTRAEVEEAAKHSNAHDFITKFPEGYATRVGERGVRLSGGQRQRIAIARMLLRRPRVLLLDEATSALDAESEALVQGALDRLIAEGGRTIVLVAHRLSTVRNADSICVLEGGRVAEHGTHEQLLEIREWLGAGREAAAVFLPSLGSGWVLGGKYSLALHSTAPHSTAQHSTAQHSTAQHSTAQHSTAQHCTAPHSTAQHSTALHSTALHSTAPHSTAQHSTAQHSTAPHRTAQHSTAHE
ncbi:unnamed protein product [Closterium sp. NIES-53]